MEKAKRAAKQDNKLKVIAECKELRRLGRCEHSCNSFHTHARDKYPSYCKQAMIIEKAR